MRLVDKTTETQGFPFEFPQNAKNVSRGTCDATYKQENV